MNTTHIQKKYESPEIIEIRIDNEISLALESAENPSSGPGEGVLLSQQVENYTTHPFEV